MFFRQLDLSGKSLAFSGSGWLDLKTDEINLTLAARGRRLATASPSVLQSLTEGLGRAVVKVEVNGQANDPQVTTRPLPVIKETLKIFGTPKGE
jgi:autotransporter translocation and assembly factor TamB